MSVPLHLRELAKREQSEGARVGGDYAALRAHPFDLHARDA